MDYNQVVRGFGQAPPKSELTAWLDSLVSEARLRLSEILPLGPREIEFLTRLGEAGEIKPELLTSDPDMQQVIAGHPALLWKAKNVREYRDKL